MSKGTAFSPIVMNLMVCVYANPDKENPFRTRNGDMASRHYPDLHWKDLADRLTKHLHRHANLPKTVKLYVANDAADILDIDGIHSHTGKEIAPAVQGAHIKAAEAIQAATYQDYRGGILDIVKGKPDQEALHIGPRLKSNGLRPPIGAFVIGLRFENTSQLTDYLGEATSPLFGAPVYISLEPSDLVVIHPGKDKTRLAPCIVKWMNAQFNTEDGFARECAVIMLPATVKADD